MVYRLRAVHLQQVIGLLTRALFDDPLSRYWLPDPQQRMELLPQIIRVSTSYGIRRGEAWATSPSLEGVAIWRRPGKVQMSAFEFARSGGLSLSRRLGPEVYRRLQTYEQYAGTLHSRHIQEPHWYLSPLAVDPPYQGQGYGSQLLRGTLEFIDQGQAPCYLVTHRERNVAIYTRHGFQVVEEGRIPGTSQPHWSLLRKR